MKNWFAEGTQQVNPAELVAFGVKLDSRHGNAEELVELLKFAHHLAGMNIAHYVESVFCNSNDGMHYITLAPGVIEGDPVYAVIHIAATDHLTQFVYGEMGVVHHGGELKE